MLVRIYVKTYSRCENEGDGWGLNSGRMIGNRKREKVCIMVYVASDDEIRNTKA